ncbi:SigB/SigF/SigG family RNA polymerase sigma factor [Cryptosporangium arvum]|uniref:RNA polymerase sigma-70 factor, sigma-B/F/G subfamily n=1 Tax=Cryptosporangium arvum DSM 44712 TaxID=927661 RepID=A0A010YPR7_9ACTN|nr:SigB/SigF/SigG family RNA polymerase sigma factor [Cryptosporangium arvum]EXG82175.1 RNA polymerase sigma-70 factor, sigma-B/F/G subfamily [Cryptosporangium arvum DSM 44712]
MTSGAMTVSVESDAVMDYSNYPMVEPLFRRLAALDRADPVRRQLRNEIALLHLPLARNLAYRYCRRGQQTEDLLQVARVGLIKAVDRFDPDRGVGFLPFAIPTITGDLRRFFRDTAWDVRLPRRLQELNLRINAGIVELSQRTGRAPTAGELAAHMEVPREDVIEGLQAGAAYTAKSLDVPAAASAEAPTLAESLGGDDRRFEAVDNHEALIDLLAALPAREKLILRLRFCEDMTQIQIARVIGVSQMHVSRLLAAVLDRLRTQLLAEP